MWPRYATVLGWMTGAEDIHERIAPVCLEKSTDVRIQPKYNNFFVLFQFLRVINLKNCESLQRHYLKEVGRGGGGDKDPTIQHSCLHLLYLCEEKTLTGGRLAEMEQEFCHYQSALTIQLGKKTSDIRFRLSMLRENQTITEDGL